MRNKINQKLNLIKIISFLIFFTIIFNLKKIYSLNYSLNIEYDIYQINYTKIYHVKSSNNLLTSFSILNNIGAYYDELSGQAHLCEHIFFKNKYNNTYIKYTLSNSGAYYNAATFNDFIIFYFTSNNKYILKNIDVFLYSVFNPSFKKIDVNTEKNVVITELNTGYQDENIYKIFSKYYKPTGGTVNDIKKIDYKILYNYWKSIYKPENLTIIIYSSLPFHYFKNSITNYFKGEIKYTKKEKIYLKNYQEIKNSLYNLDSNFYKNFINFINKEIKDFETLESKDYFYFYIETKNNIIYYDLLSEIINKKYEDSIIINNNNLEISSSFIPTKLANYFIIKIKKTQQKGANFYKNYLLNIINSVDYKDLEYAYLKSYSDYLYFFSSNFDFIQFFSFLVGLNILREIQKFLNP